MLPRIDVIGGSQNLPNIGGTADTLDAKMLEASRVFTVNEALRKVPGVNVRDEEGFGIRPNIAMRGLNPTRSTKITLLEDGIPLAYAVGAFRGELEAQHVGKQYSDFANTVAPSADGQTGEIAAHTVWNAAFNYRFDKSLSGFLTAKNLADKVYITDRTRGIQVGQPRLVQVGVKYAF